jgi:hypothetical protein
MVHGFSGSLHTPCDSLQVKPVSAHPVSSSHPGVHLPPAHLLPAEHWPWSEH